VGEVWMRCSGGDMADLIRQSGVITKSLGRMPLMPVPY